MEKSVQDKAMIYKCHVNSLKISPVNIPKKNYYFDMEILSQNNILPYTTKNQNVSEVINLIYQEISLTNFYQIISQRLEDIN